MTNLILPVVDRWRAHSGLGRGYALITANATANGVLLLVGGDGRVSARAFATLRAVGNWPLWGTLLAALGGLLAILAVVGTARLVRVGMLTLAVLHTLLALWFYNAASNDPLAAYLGAVNFLTLACWCISQQDEYRAGSL